MKLTQIIQLIPVFILLLPLFAVADIKPVIVSSSNGIYVQVQDEGKVIFSSLNNQQGIIIYQPSGISEIKFKSKTEKNGILSLAGGITNGLDIFIGCKITV